GEGDTGPNTGGMGTYSPAEVVTPALFERIEREIVKPSVDAIADEGIDFRGTLFIGIMLTAQGPQVLEYNTRFGDPETQVVLPRIKSDVLDLLWRAAQASPGVYQKCDVLSPLSSESLPRGVSSLRAGAARKAAGQLAPAGGRVLGVTAVAPPLRQAADAAYQVCQQVTCATKVYRTD